MNLNDLINTFTDGGWKQFNRSSDKDRAWLRLNTDEITIEIMVRSRLLSQNFAISTLYHFCKSEHYTTELKIYDSKRDQDKITPYMYRISNSFRFEYSSTPKEVYTSISDSLSEAVESFDYDIFLQECVNSRPDLGLDFQLNHITALAIKGEYAKLMDYLDSFKNGNRLNFLEPITTEKIDRALDVALMNSKL